MLSLFLPAATGHCCLPSGYPQLNLHSKGQRWLPRIRQASEKDSIISPGNALLQDAGAVLESPWKRVSGSRVEERLVCHAPSTFSFHSMKVEFHTEKPLQLRRTSVLPLQCDAKTKCYNFKDCNPLYIHLPKEKKIFESHPSPRKKNPTCHFSYQDKVNDENANNFKSHLSVGFLTRNYTCLA